MKPGDRSIALTVGSALLLMALSSWVCLRIEQLNAQCDALPNREWYADDPASGPVKWRQALWTNEAMWREAFLKHAFPDDYATRELTDAQRSEMRRTIDRAKANNTLRDFVGSWGLLQYLAVPSLVGLSVLGLLHRRPWRWVWSVPLAVGLLCGWRMWQLAYFTSLGW